MKMIKTLTILCSFFLFCTAIVAQNKDPYTVKGTVVDALGDEVIGASVFAKGTDRGTITDLDGKFSITVPGNVKHLIISYVGHKKQEVSVSPSKNELTVTLETSNSIDELVVVGYGVQKKTNLTSSVETIKAEELLKMPTVNLDEALVGQVPGLQSRTASGDPSVARETDIRIRGMKSPLLVIDGIPQNAESVTGNQLRLSDLNPDDIESINILKDAASAAVYGMRGANGVILVTTKRGQQSKKVKLNYRGQFNLQEATKLPKFVNAYEFAQLHNVASENSGRDPKYTPEILEQIKNGTNRNVYADENLLDYLDKTGYNMSHSLSASGGNETVHYYISGAYVNSKGLYSGVGRDRYNYSVKLDTYLSQHLTLGVDVMGSFSDYKNTRSSAIDAAYSSSPLDPLRFDNGQLASLNGGNPLISLEGLGGYVKSKYNMNTINARLKYNTPFVKGLSAYFQWTMDKNNSTIENFGSPVTLYLYDANNQTFSPDKKTMYPDAKITLSERNQYADKFLYEVGANYAGTFGLHSVTGLLVANYEEYKTRYLQGTNEDMPGAYPPIIGVTKGPVTGSEHIGEMASLIGRGTYSYDSRYFFESSFRVDGSTAFHPDDRWVIFPTVSAAWAIFNEDFFKNWKQNILTNAKIRGSVGKLGDKGTISDYQYLDNYMFTPNQGYQFGDFPLRPGIVPHSNYNTANPYLVWGKSTDYNIATDLGFWDNRINVTFEHYWKIRTDYIDTAPSYMYPPSTGVAGNLPYYNLGKVKIWGWDLNLNHRNSINNFKYDVTFVISDFKDKVLDWGDESTVPPNMRRKGLPFAGSLMYEADGLFQSWEEIAEHKLDQDGQGNASLAPGDIKYKDQANKLNDKGELVQDGKLDENDQIIVKNSSFPDMSYSFKVNLSYKGFFLNTMFQGVAGYQQNLNDIYTLEGRSLQRFQKYHRDETWREDRPDAKYPRLKFATDVDNNRKVSTYWIEKANFLRLKMLSVGYSLPASKAKNLGLSSLSISIQGSNLITWSSLKDMDPESLRGYPIQRSYGISLNLGF